MQRRVGLAVLGCLGWLAGLAAPASAAPVFISKIDAVAPPRKDPGTGLCGSTSKFKNQPGPLVTIDDALLLLNRPVGDPNIVNRTARLFQTMNFSVGPTSEADFRSPMFPDDYFPYCQDPMAMPAGNDDNNIVMRIRGYLNVPDNFGGNPVTYAVKCDDGCALFVGRSRQFIMQANDDSPLLTGRRARWVSFLDPGLYPVEIVYFQNSTTGYLEWSRANMSLFPSDDLAVDNLSWLAQALNFKPVSGVDLYSGVVGSNPACVECGEPGMDCTTGSYCGDGLCQPCNLADHCGAACVKCPADRAICDAGKCVECTSDAMCPSGSKCDTTSGTCKPPTGCTTNAQCRPPEVCLPEGSCGEPPKCRTDVDCEGRVGCACADGSTTCMQKVCIVPPPPVCTTDAQCPDNFHCDTLASLCRENSRYLYEGGLQEGCSVGGASTAASHAAPFFALLGFALASLRRRRNRR